VLGLALCAGCVQYTEDGSLVRHHLGYVKVITPPQAASDRPLQSLDIETLGVWLDVDRRAPEQHAGSGFGLGWRDDRRDIVPIDCRVVFRVASIEQLDIVARMIADSGTYGRSLCATLDED
jgi:hypothetical protein